MVMAHAHGHHRPRGAALRQPAASAASGRVLRRLTGKTHCPRCNDSGAVWVICPDAGAIKLPCDCGRTESHHAVGIVDAGLAAAFVACCGAAYLLF
jgi:hypothetical protein